MSPLTTSSDTTGSPRPIVASPQRGPQPVLSVSGSCEVTVPFSASAITRASDGASANARCTLPLNVRRRMSPSDPRRASRTSMSPMPVSSRSTPPTRATTIGPRRTSAPRTPATSATSSRPSATRSDAMCARRGTSIRIVVFRRASVPRCTTAMRTPASLLSTTTGKRNRSASDGAERSTSREMSSRDVPSTRTDAIDASTRSTAAGGSAILRRTRSATSAAARRVGMPSAAPIITSRWRRASSILARWPRTRCIGRIIMRRSTRARSSVAPPRTAERNRPPVAPPRGSPYRLAPPPAGRDVVKERVRHVTHLALISSVQDV